MILTPNSRQSLQESRNKLNIGRLLGFWVYLRLAGGRKYLLFCLDSCGDNLHAVLNDFFNMFNSCSLKDAMARSSSAFLSLRIWWRSRQASVSALHIVDKHYCGLGCSKLSRSHLKFSSGSDFPCVFSSFSSRHTSPL